MSVGVGRITAFQPSIDTSLFATGSFSTIQTPAGTSPVADSPNDTLTLSSSDSTITITGTAATDTINFQARVASATESGIVSISTQTFQGSKTFSAITNMNTTSSSVTPLLIKGAASQTENLTRWVDSSNNLKAYVDPNGNIGFGTLIGTTATVTAAATLNANTFIHKANGSIASFTATLPAHVAGKSIIVYNPSADYNVTVAAGSGSLLGPTSLALSATAEKEAAFYTSDGTDWYGFRIGKSAASPGAVPIGGIVAWHKSLTGVPSLPADYVECNGGTISDVSSPMNGQAIPQLNAGNEYFLRGYSSSGATGGSTCHRHSLGSICVDVGTLSFSGATVDTSGLGVTGSDSISVFLGESKSTTSVDNTGSGSTTTVLCDITFTPYATSSWSGSISGSASISGGSITGCGSIGAGQYTDYETELPPYFQVVWVMRIY